MKLKLFICLMILSAPALAADDTSWYSGIFDFFDWIADAIADFTATFIDGISAFVRRAYAYYIEAAVVIKLYLYVASLELAYGIAQEIANDLNLFGYLSTAISGLPSDVQYIMNLWGIPNAINIVINAYITKFVMNFMGW